MAVQWELTTYSMYVQGSNSRIKVNKGYYYHMVKLERDLWNTTWSSTYIHRIGV